MKNNFLSLQKVTLLFIVLFISTQVYSQFTLDKVGLTSGSPASVAYGMRLLSSSYTGSSIQVRRSSDNTTLDIGFTASGDLDTVSLKAFTGTGNAFVTTWYDQSGNTPSRNLTQTTAINQPSIISGGVISRQHARPSIKFTNAPAFNSLNLSTNMTTVGHVSVVFQMPAGSDGFILGHSGDYYWHSELINKLFSSAYTSSSIKDGFGWTNGVPTEPLNMGWPATLTVTEIAPSSNVTGVRWNNIGRDRVYHYTTNGGYSELIVFPTALSVSAREALYNSQQTYFQIGSFTLPVTWLSFIAQQKEENVLLKWQTANEQNTNEFIVQHSLNGVEWKNIANLPAGNNSNTILSYQYKHSNPTRGINHYRILQTDLDDRYNYSETRKVKFAKESQSFNLIGSPANGVVQVQVHKKTFLSLFNANGLLIWKKQFSEGVHNLNVNGFAKGIYILKNDQVIKKFVL